MSRRILFVNTNSKLRQMTLAAVFAGAITLVTAYMLHIPIPTGGYVHLGDTLIYLAASFMPAPYAIFASSVGAGLADLLTAPLWTVPTLIIKALVALLFTCKSERLLCKRNTIAVFAASVISPVLYSIAGCIIMKDAAVFIPQLIGTFIQAFFSGILYFSLCAVLEKNPRFLKRKLAKNFNSHR